MEDSKSNRATNQEQILFSKMKKSISEKEYNATIEYSNDLIKITKDPLILAEAYSSLGFVYYMQNSFYNSIKFYELSLNHYHINPITIEVVSQKIKILNSLGVLYNSVKDFEKSIEVLHESIKLSEKFKIKNTNVYNSIALHYYSQNKLEKSIKFIKQAIEYELNSIDVNYKQIARYEINLATFYTANNEFKFAKEIYLNNVKNCIKNNDFEFLIAVYKGLANLNIIDGNLNESKNTLLKALDINLNENIIFKKIELYLILYDIYVLENNYSLQIDSLSNAEKISKESNDIHQLEILEKKIECFERVKEYQSAFECLKKLRKIDIGNYNVEKDSRYFAIQKKFENDYNDLMFQKEKEFNEILLFKNKELESVNDDLQQFNYGVSHDLKEPIRSIKSRLLFLNASIKNKISKEEVQGLEEALQASKRLEKMLEDMHTFSKLGSDINKQMEFIDLNRVLSIVQSDLQQRIKENNAIIELDNLPTLPGYTNLYVQLFQNLINNAIKFKRENVQPHIQVRYEQLKGQHIIKVIDNGVGIKKENQAKVFQLFARVKESQHIEGSGVGLSIVQKIVSKLNGSIALESDYGKGTTFIIIL